MNKENRKIMNCSDMNNEDNLEISVIENLEDQISDSNARLLNNSEHNFNEVHSDKNKDPKKRKISSYDDDCEKLGKAIVDTLRGLPPNKRYSLMCNIDAAFAKRVRFS